jgi:hypothetical protein
MPRFPFAALISTLLLTVWPCAPDRLLAKPAKSAHTPSSAAAEQAAVAKGVLSDGEVKLDCKRMAGRMKIRILELRGGGTVRKGSGTAQGMQSVLVPIFGGTQRGADASADNQRDVAKLDAMNAILIARKCPYYDLERELAKDHSAPLPRLIRASGKRGKAKR